MLSTKRFLNKMKSKKNKKSSISKNILGYFLTWRIVIFFVLFLSIPVLKLQTNYLGGGLISYLKNPTLWSFANFDGVHYLNIAYKGYLPLTYFYFPLFPLTIRMLSVLSGQTLANYAFIGILASNLFFLVAIWGFVKLIRLDHSEVVAKITLLMLLVFPTSFYFGSLYTESLFLMLSIWTFYFARKDKWLFAGLLGFLLTATRIVGIAIVPSLFIILWHKYADSFKKIKKESLANVLPKLFWVLLPVGGILSYMYFLWTATGDPLEFFHSISVFGEQRSASFILPPRVFYRYVFKIIPSLDYSYFPVVFTTLLEIVTAGLVSFVLVWASYKKLKKELNIRLEYLFFMFFTYLTPIFSGSFSSFPRYTLAIFPFFIYLSIFLMCFQKKIQYAFLVLSGFALIVSASLFLRGYWLS